MTVYTTQADLDTYYSLVTDDFLVLQQLRIQPAPCKCLIRDEDGPWRWIPRKNAEQILAAWQRASQKQAA